LTYRGNCENFLIAFFQVMSYSTGSVITNLLTNFLYYSFGMVIPPWTLLYNNDFRIYYWYSLLWDILHSMSKLKCLCFHYVASWDSTPTPGYLMNSPRSFTSRHSVCHWIKSASSSLFIKILCLWKTQASLLDLLITFVNNFQLNLVVMFVYFVNQSSVLNLIYLE
jgi:hypothetical protein